MKIFLNCLSVPEQLYVRIINPAKKTPFLRLVSVLTLCLMFICGGSLTGFTQEATNKGQQSQKQGKVCAFGYDLFRALPEPITEGPVDEEYLLSPRDEIIVTVWGQLTLKYPLTVSEDGYIDIPDGGGRIFTNGVSLKELKKLITKNLSQIYSSYINLDNPSKSTAFVDVKLAKVRKLLVYVVGEVKTPGVYTISSSVATLLNLLNNAGGVREAGSLRKIMIRRANGKVDIFDFYDFLITGKIDTKKTRIMYGDYIIVPLKKKTVTIQGEVRRPGKYEVIGNEGVKALVRFAGGLTSNAYLKRSQVRRHEIDIGEKFIDLDLKGIFNGPKKDFSLMDGDKITIFPNIVIRRKLVEIRGDGIKRPGIYQYKEGMTVRDLIKQAEGLTEYVYLDRADLVRTEENFSKRFSTFSLKNLYKEKKHGLYVCTENKEKDFALKELDRINIYSSYEIKGGDKHVTLEGHVKEPGRYVLPENMTLYDLIFSRGGFQNEDFKKRTYLKLAHIFRKSPGKFEERIISFNLAKLLEGDPKENLPLKNSDRVKIYSYETLEKKPFVTIQGLVKRPGSYLLAQHTTLKDLILIAGGLRPNAYNVEAVIARMKPATEKEQKGVATLAVPIGSDLASMRNEKKIHLEAYDKVVIRNLPRWQPLPIVSVMGEVLYPGNYSLESKEERISSVIKKAGGLKKDAFPEGVVFSRRKDIIEMSPLRQEEKEKIAINLEEALKNPGGPYDLALKDGDQIYVPGNPESVEVKGAIRNPSILQHRKGKGLKYYIELCGGYQKDANIRNTVVCLPNGTAIKKKSVFFSGSNPSILPGSTIEVPFEEEKKGLKTDNIEVRGAVGNPTLVMYRKGEKLEYYIDFCGGYNRNADIEKILIHLPDGKIIEKTAPSAFNPLILPGSIIEVPFEENKEIHKPAQNTGEK